MLIKSVPEICLYNTLFLFHPKFLAFHWHYLIIWYRHKYKKLRGCGKIIVRFGDAVYQYF
jgi:hypothetical protein